MVLHNMVDTGISLNVPCLYTACEDLNDVSLVYILCHEEMLKVQMKDIEERKGNSDGVEGGEKN